MQFSFIVIISIIFFSSLSVYTIAANKDIMGNFEQLGKNTAFLFKDFLDRSVEDTLFLSKLNYSNLEKVKIDIEAFSDFKQDDIWYNIGTDLSPIEQKKTISLYSEISFIDKNGIELIKYSNGKFIMDLKNVSNPKNTQYNNETYFVDTKDLEKGKVFIGDVMTWYTHLEDIFKEMPKEDFNKFEKVISRDLLKNGIIRFSTPIYQNNEFIGMIVLSLDYRHLQELTKHVEPGNINPVVSSSYSKNYLLVFDIDGNTIIHPKPNNIRGYLEDGGLAGYNEENPKRDGKIFNLYKYHKSKAYPHMASTTLDNKKTYTTSSTDVSGRVKATVTVPIFYSNPKTNYENIGVFGGIMMSIKVDNTEQVTDVFDQQAKEIIKQRALDIAKQIEIYLKAYNYKNITSLQNDEEFKNIVIQQVGKTGYTFAYDCNSMINLFHAKDKFIGLNYTSLKDEKGREDWWKITQPTVDCLSDAEGIYQWKDTDDIFRDKYKYTTIIKIKTADGTNLALGASTYLYEYNNENVKPNKDIDSLNSEQSEFDILEKNKINIDFFRTILFMVLVLVVIFFFSSLESKNQELVVGFKGLLFTSIISILATFFTYQYNSNIVFFMRLLFSSLFFYQICFLWIILSIKKNFACKNNLKLWIIGIGISILLLSTKIIINNVDSLAKIDYGFFFLPLMILTSLISIVSLCLSFYNVKKDSKSIILISIINILFVFYNFIIGSLHLTVQYLQEILMILTVIFTGILMFRLKILEYKRNATLILLSVSFLIIIILFAFNTYQTTNSMENDAIDSFNEQQILIVHNAAKILETTIDLVIKNSVVFSYDDILSGKEEDEYEILGRLYERLKDIVDSVYLLNDLAVVRARVPYKESYHQTFKEYSQKPGVKESLISQQIEVSDIFNVSSGKTVFSIVVPISKNDQIKGMLRLNIELSNIIEKYLSIEETDKTSNLYLMINDKIFLSNNITVNAPIEIQNDINSGITGKFQGESIHPNSDEEVIINYHPIVINSKNWGVLTETKKTVIIKATTASTNKIWLYTAGILISLIIMGIIFNKLLTKSLRAEIDIKTKEIKNFNKELEKIVEKRTIEVAQKSKELELLNQSLGTEVDNKTIQLQKKLKNESKSTQAMIHILERAKRTNLKLESKQNELDSNNKILKNQSKELKEKRDEMDKDLKIQQIISTISFLFVHFQNFKKNTKDVIELLGDIVKVSRIFIFENFDNEKHTKNTFEWCNENIPSLKTNYQNVNYSSISKWKDQLIKNKSIKSSDVNDLPKDMKQFVKKRKSKSILVLPIVVEFKFYGFFGFEDCKTNRVWNKHEITLLRTVSNILSYAFERKKYEDNLNKTVKKLKITQNWLEIEKKNVEKKVKQRTNQLDIERAKVQDLLDKKIDFINQLSHDLRTPLTPILSLLPIALNHIEDKKIKHYITISLSNAKFVKTLISDTLQLSRLDKGAMQLDLQNINMSQLVKELLMENEIVFKKENIAVKNLTKQDHYALADPTRIKEVIHNIFSNAIKFMDTNKKLEFNVIGDRRNIIVSIKDSGIGMTTKQQNRVFEEFYKADTSRHDAAASSGLGLAICQKILRKMNGKIWCKSAGVGKGSTFYFSIPKYNSKKVKKKN
jgi:signal transduction histidine kinase